jgi:hypothetical protein
MICSSVNRFRFICPSFDQGPDSNLRWRKNSVAGHDLQDYTFKSLHGAYLKRTSEWFEPVEGPQLVVWDVEENARPSFFEAWERLQDLKQNGPSERGYGWKT